MSNIVFIVGFYYPYFSPNGTCCHNIAEEIATQHNVTVVCMKRRFGQSERERFQGQTIIRVSHKWWDYQLKLDEKIKKSSGYIKNYYTMLLNTVRAKQYLQIIFSRVSLHKSWISAYRNGLEKIEYPIDVLIPLTLPMESVVAGSAYMKTHHQTTMVPFLCDPFVYNHRLHKTKWNMLLKSKSNMAIEDKMLNISFKVFCLNYLRDRFVKDKEYKDKLIFIEHPLLKKIYVEDMKVRFEQGNMQLTYAGVFDKFLRSPEYLLRIMSYILPQIDARLHLYAFGNCADIIKKYSSASEGRIIDHGFVPKEKANSALYASDLLICVGNVDNSQVPSKIFEYMSTGKPIAYFYTVDDDANLNILKDYPLCIFLKQDASMLHENIGKLIRFCRDTKGKTLDFTEVGKNYYYAKPKFIADQFLEIINRCLSNT